MFIGEDVTEVRAFEPGLMHADRLASLGTMAAGIAHGRQQPLTFVQASLNLALHRLGERRPPPESQAFALRILEEVRTASVGVDRIAALVRDARALARTQQGSRPPPTWP
ncbi:MAG: hypothetical protein IPJ34_22230 [Myxococcales bacterium]|nr:hypothetical protein [Myxococcales bacterium]